MKDCKIGILPRGGMYDFRCTIYDLLFGIFDLVVARRGAEKSRRATEVCFVELCDFFVFSA